VTTPASGRVALLLPSLECGGAERVFVTLANAFERRGLPVDLVVATRTGSLSREVAPGVNLVVLGGSRAIASLAPLVRYLRRTRPAAILSTMIDMNLLVMAATLLVRPPVVVLRETTTASVHAREGGGLTNAVMAGLRRWAYRRADHVVSPSRGVADDLERIYRIGASMIVMIPNPVDIEQLRRLAGDPDRPVAFVDSSAPLIVAVGRLSQEKDYPTLIAAFARVRRGSPARLLILGEGDERPALERLVDQLGLRDEVRMPGFLDNPFAYMSDASVFVLSSRYEGLPNSLLQAVAVGVPVVATDCPSGPREILEDGRWGRLVPVGDVEGMAAAIGDALHGHVDVMPAAAVRQRFGVEVVADQYLRLLGIAVPAADACR
jgi:glycosyltransferase involved in cell wall biosynthesis